MAVTTGPASIAGMLRFAIGAWMVGAMFIVFTVNGVLDGRARDVVEGGIPAALFLAIAFLLTRKLVRDSRARQAVDRRA